MEQPEKLTYADKINSAYKIVELKQEDFMGCPNAYSVFVLGRRVFFAIKKAAALRLYNEILEAMDMAVRLDRREEG